MRGQKNLLVVITRLALRLHVHKPELPRKSTLIQVPHRHDMRVIPPRSRGPRHERQFARPVRRNQRRSFLLRTIHIGRNKLPMPMNQLRHIGIVVHIDRHALSFAHAQQRSRYSAVVSHCLDNLSGSYFQLDGSDAKGEIGFTCDVKRPGER